METFSKDLRLKKNLSGFVRTFAGDRGPGGSRSDK